MNISNNSNVSKIQETIEVLLELEQFDKVEKIIHEFSNYLSDDEDAYDAYLNEFQGMLLYKKEKLNESLENYQKSLSIWKRKKKFNKVASIQHRIAEVYDLKGAFETSIKYVNEALEWFKKESNLLGEANCLFTLGSLHIDKGNTDYALDFLFKSLKIRKEREIAQFKIAQNLHSIGSCYWDKGDLNNALQYYQEAFQIRKDLNHEPAQAKTLNNIGLVYYDLGDIQKALEYYQQAIYIRRKFEPNLLLANSLHNSGIVLREMGELDKALEYFQESFEIRKKVGNSSYIASSLSGIANTYHARGDLERALKWQQEALEIRRKIGNKQEIQGSLYFLGKIYSDRNERNKALGCFTESLKIAEILGRDLNTASCLFELILFDLENCDQYLNKLDSLNKESSKLISLWSQLAKAIHLSKDTRMLKKSQAQLLLNDLASENFQDVSSRFLVIHTLCDTLLFELQASKESEVYNELFDFIKELTFLSEKAQSVNFLAESLLLKSKLAVYDDNLEQANYYLEQALKVTENNDYWKLQKKVLSRQNDLRKSFNTNKINHLNNSHIIKENLDSISNIAEELELKKQGISGVQLSGYIQKQEQQQRIIKTLQMHPAGLLQKELIDKAGLSKATLSRRVRELENDSIIIRIPEGNSLKLKLLKSISMKL
jgi:tetratricopeptide (TPR) repeat protein